MPVFSSETLDNVLRRCDDKTKNRSVLVCKKWSEVALDLLWYKVENLEHFLKLFGELNVVAYEGKTAFVSYFKRFYWLY